jgi:hypothetical protein
MKSDNGKGKYYELEGIKSNKHYIKRMNIVYQLLSEKRTLYVVLLEKLISSQLALSRRAKPTHKRIKIQNQLKSKLLTFFSSDSRHSSHRVHVLILENPLVKEILVR